MTIKYSIQPSTLLPNGQTDPHGHYRVQVQDDHIITVNSTHTAIASLLKAGGQVVLVGSDNEPIGWIIPSLKGGFLLSESPTPTAENISIGFRPSSALLEDTRQSVDFERLDTVVRNPAITLVSEWYQNERSDGAISVNGGHSNYVEIKGSNLKLEDSLTITLTEIGGGATSVELANDQGGLIKWTEHLITFNTKVNIATPETTGTLTVTVGDKTASTTVTIIDRT